MEWDDTIRDLRDKLVRHLYLELAVLSDESSIDGDFYEKLGEFKDVVDYCLRVTNALGGVTARSRRFTEEIASPTYSVPSPEPISETSVGHPPSQQLHPSEREPSEREPEDRGSQDQYAEGWP